jgi:hypothetical protein
MPQRTETVGEGWWAGKKCIVWREDVPAVRLHMFVGCCLASSSMHQNRHPRTSQRTADTNCLKFYDDSSLELIDTWDPGPIGTSTVGADLGSPSGFALRRGRPVISNRHLE